MIHKYKLNGYNIVLDVNSGAVHVVDDLAYEILDFIDENMAETLSDDIVEKLSEKYDRNEILDTYSELYELYNNGQLYTKDEYEKFASMMVNSPVKSMCLNISHDCNLRCEYCFAAKGDFGTGRELMPFETAKKAIDFLIEKSGNRHNLEADFFGGEPLMNFDVVKKTVEYARSIEKEHDKNFRFTITTNGLLLTDDKIDFINREMSNVVLSLDGRKEVNDKLRVSPNGSGSYDIIVPKYQKLVAERGDKDYYVRGTFTKNNLDFTKDVIKMSELGFDQLSIEPVVSDAKLEYSIKEEDLPRVFEEYETLAREMIKRKKSGKCFNFFHFMIDLDQGDVYPCHQFVGNEQWRMGNVVENSFDNEIKTKFAKTNIYTKEKCKDCWAKFFCSGGCNANSWQYEGDIARSHDISCELEKKRLECALMIKAATV